ncbi:GWxTD domain-containing protein [candidate division KSB1 bacterium]|nr:GWxTD domain-containing protein [candidate division KSB1 bacterium]
MYPIRCRLREASCSHLASRTTLIVALILPFLFPLISPVYPQNGEFPRFAEAYLLRLQSVAAETLINEFEKEFLLLLDQREKQYYAALPLPERRTYIARYWRLRDPDPFTPGNARLEEHLRRRDHARENFGMKKPPYFDDRGQIYLKYGRPKIRYVDPGSAMHLNTELMIFLPDIQTSNQSSLADSGGFEQRVDPGWVLNTGKALNSLLAPGRVSVLANESWNYEHITPDLVFNFVREGGRFRLVTDLRQAVIGGRMRDRTLQTAALYLQRQNHSPVYFNLARDLEDVGHQMRDWPGESQLSRLDNTIQLALDRSIRTVKESIRKSPAEAFIRKVAEPELPFFADLAQFRGGQNQTRIAVSIGVDLGAASAIVDSGGYHPVAVIYSCILSDHNGEPVTRAEKKKTVPITTAGTASVLGSVGVMEIDCNPDQYLMFLRAADANGPRRSIGKLPLVVRDFSGDHLMLSDMQFYMPISGVESQAEAAEVKLLPYPIATVLKFTPLTVYFEIYNLSAIGLNNEYRIDYNVTEFPTGQNLLSEITKPFRKSDEASITLSEMRIVTKPMSRESLTLDFGKLRPGAYRLEVRVSAMQDSSVVVSIAKSLVLAEEKK